MGESWGWGLGGLCGESDLLGGESGGWIGDGEIEKG